MFKKYSSRFISIVLFLIFTVSIFTPSAYAVYYENSFPYVETGLTGGYYIECGSSIGDIVIIIPEQYHSGYLTFTTSGSLYNASSSSITCVLFLNGVQYNARIPAFDGLEYRRVNTAGYTYEEVSTSVPSDTNVIFNTASNYVNENFYFSFYETAVISLLLMILFFVFLGWFLWHRRT